MLESIFYLGQNFLLSLLPTRAFGVSLKDQLTGGKKSSFENGPSEWCIKTAKAHESGNEYLSREKYSLTYQLIEHLLYLGVKWDEAVPWAILGVVYKDES